MLSYSYLLCTRARVDQTLALVHFARFSFDSFSPVRIVKAYAISMENDLNNPDASVTNAGLKAEFGKFEEKMEQLLSEQANVILEAVDETIEKRLDEKFDPVITKLDGILKGVEALQQENTIGAKQLRRHEDQLQDHTLRIKKLELSPRA